MTIIKIKGFHFYTDRNGHARCYHRKTRISVDLKKYEIGSAEFFARCAEIKTKSETPRASKPGTLGLLINRYRAHDDFLRLKMRTRQDYQRCFDYLQAIQETPLVSFKATTIVKIRDEAGQALGRKWGNYVKSALSLVFNWGKERGYVETNPAFQVKGIKKPKNAPQANRPWADFERHAVEAALPAHLKVPIALMMYCALDPIDALTLPKPAIANGHINTKRNKTNEPVWVTLPDPVISALEAAPKHDAITVAANSYGKPWSKSGFDNVWGKAKKALEASGAVNHGLTLKGLRHTVATMLAEMGYDDRTIADMLGQKTLAMAQHYSNRANRSRKMDAVVTNFNAELVRRKGKI